MQRILDKLVTRTNRWDIDFNANKCGVMLVGTRNLVSVPNERWLGQISR